MNRQARRWLMVAAAVGALGVTFGAFGAHGVPRYLEGRGFDAPAVEARLANFETAARYHLYGGLFLAVAALAADRLPGRAIAIAAWCMLLGVLVFCGAVYAVALVPDDMRSTLGMLAPIGGTLMIAGWVALGIAALGGEK